MLALDNIKQEIKKELLIDLEEKQRNSISALPYLTVSVASTFSPSYWTTKMSRRL